MYAIRLTVLLQLGRRCNFSYATHTVLLNRVVLPLALAFQDVSPTLVTLRRWRNLLSRKILRKHAIGLELSGGGPRAFLQIFHRKHAPSPLAGWGEGVAQHPTHQALLWCALRQLAHSLYRSTPSMQASGVHRISPTIGQFSASAAQSGVIAARTTTTRSPRETKRYILRSG